MERFYRTLQEYLIRETDFDSPEELKDELWQYQLYYNHYRPHQGIQGKTTVEMCSKEDETVTKLPADSKT